METSDVSILEGLQREKNEEIGPEARIRVYLDATYNLLFRKKDGNSLILPHYLAQYTGGEMQLNAEEYSEYQWVPLDQVDAFEPKIDNIPVCIAWAQKLQVFAEKDAFVEI